MITFTLLWHAFELQVGLVSGNALAGALLILMTRVILHLPCF